MQIKRTDVEAVCHVTINQSINHAMMENAFNPLALYIYSSSTQPSTLQTTKIAQLQGILKERRKNCLGNKKRFNPRS